jgi:uncharacterized protein involved in response to NO
MRRFALWDLGFRPFYLAAAAYAAVSVALWALQYSGRLGISYVAGPTWHAHEMLFGFAIAVIAGFLFTAVPNWTGKPTPRGAALAAIVMLWIAGRVLVLTPFAGAAAAVNVAFPLVVAIGIAKPLAQSRNRRNYFFVALLCAFAGVELAMHLSAMGLLERPPRSALQAGLDVVLFVVAVVAGRVIPMFTNNGVPGAGAQRNLIVDRISLGALLALLAADLFDAAWLVGGLAFAAGVAHAWRLALWRPWRTLRAPLVWVLHAAYAWIAVHLLLRALATAGLVAETLAIHALTIGVIGGMTIGMMTRTALGHTGRRLVAGGIETTCYVLILLAAIVRVFGGWLLPQHYLATVIVSAACWSAGYALYCVKYAGIVASPRVDGR